MRHPERSLARLLATNAVEGPRRGSYCPDSPALSPHPYCKELLRQDTRNRVASHPELSSFSSGSGTEINDNAAASQPQASESWIAPPKVPATFVPGSSGAPRVS